MMIKPAKQQEWIRLRDNATGGYESEPFEFAERWADSMEMVKGKLTRAKIMELKEEADVNSISGSQYDYAKKLITEYWYEGKTFAKLMGGRSR